MNTEYEVRSIAEETMSSKHSTSMIECSNSSGGFCGVFSVGLFFWSERKKERLEIVLESGYAMSCDVSACKENLLCSSFTTSFTPALGYSMSKHQRFSKIVPLRLQMVPSLKFSMLGTTDPVSGLVGVSNKPLKNQCAASVFPLTLSLETSTRMKLMEGISVGPLFNLASDLVSLFIEWFGARGGGVKANSDLLLRERHMIP